MIERRILLDEDPMVPDLPLLIVDPWHAECCHHHEERLRVGGLWMNKWLQ
jgi:hypothetical protein